MFINNFKAEFGLALPAPSLLGCLVLAGCGDDSTFKNQDDWIEIVPNEIGISPWSKPVPVTATWKTTKDGGTFEEWTKTNDPRYFTLKVDQTTKSPMKIEVACSQNLATPAELHKHEGSLGSQAHIGAVVQRNGNSKYLSAYLRINILLPYLTVTEVYSNRTGSNVQKVDIDAILSLELKNPPDQTNYNIDLSAARGRVWACVPNQNCNPEALGAPTISRVSGSSGNKVFFELKQAVNTTSPRTIGRIEYYYQATASPVGGGVILKSEGPIIW